ncbi:hypothetical protein TomTYG75_07730 [Sphingobium sp. TomTYG75]
MSDAGLSTADKDARIAELEAALAAAHADISARDILIDTLRVQIARLKRMQFGKSSEKLDTQIAQLELALEELEGEAIVAAARRGDPAAVDRSAPVRALPAHLPREERRIEPEQGTCACPDCGGALRPLGQDSDEMLDAVPVQWRVVRTIRPKYSCRSCEKIVQAPAPVKAIARGKATFGTLAHVVVSKFDHHLPLYRQAEIMAAQGIEIDRSTLAGWVGQASVLLDPIISRIREVGLTAAKIHTDDTPVPMLDPGRGKTATGRLWAYAVDDRSSGATTQRRSSGMSSPPTAPARIPSGSWPASAAICRPMVMPAMTSSTTRTASPRLLAGRISGARYSTSTPPSRRRSPLICWNASASFTRSRQKFGPATRDPTTKPAGPHPAIDR